MGAYQWSGPVDVGNKEPIVVVLEEF